MCTMYINCMFYFNTTKASNHSKAISNSYHHHKTHYKICPVRDVHSFMFTMPTPALRECQILPVRFLADRFKTSYLLRQTHGLI